MSKKNSWNSESISSKEEIEALGLNHKEGLLVLGRPNIRLNYPDFMKTIKGDREKPLAKQSGLTLNREQKNKIVLIHTKANLKSQEWVNDFIKSINRGGEQQDEALIRSILSKLADSDLFDMPSINKILYEIAEASLSILANQKLARLLVQLEVPFTGTMLLPTVDGAFQSSYLTTDQNSHLKEIKEKSGQLTNKSKQLMRTYKTSLDIVPSSGSESVVPEDFPTVPTRKRVEPVSIESEYQKSDVIITAKPASV